MNYTAILLLCVSTEPEKQKVFSNLAMTYDHIELIPGVSYIVRWQIDLIRTDLITLQATQDIYTTATEIAYGDSRLPQSIADKFLSLLKRTNLLFSAANHSKRMA